MNNEKLMKKYKVKNVVFIPEGPVILTIDNKPVDIKPQQAKLFQYFLDTRQKRSTKNEILDAV